MDTKRSCDLERARHWVIDGFPLLVLMVRVGCVNSVTADLQGDPASRWTGSATGPAREPSVSSQRRFSKRRWRSSRHQRRSDTEGPPATSILGAPDASKGVHSQPEPERLPAGERLIGDADERGTFTAGARDAGSGTASGSRSYPLVLLYPARPPG